MIIKGLGDRYLGADTVGGCGEDGMLHGGDLAGVEESGEAAEIADHLRPAGLGDGVLDQLDGQFTGVDIDARCGVCGVTDHDVPRLLEV